MRNTKLNILYVAHERKLGGATVSLLALIDEMKLKGHQIYVIVPTAGCPLAKELRKRKIMFYPVFFAWWLMPSKWHVIEKKCFRLLYKLEDLQIFLLYRRLRKKEIDIIHTNSSVTDFGAKLAQKHQAKHIWHIREFGDADYDLEYMQGKKETWTYINKHTDRIIFISQNLRNYFKDNLDIIKSEVIYNGIAPKYFYKREYRDKGYINFLISANINRNKNQMLVLKSCKILLNQGVENFKVYIAGSSTSMTDSKKYENELKAYALENLGGHAVFLGRVEDIVNLRKNMDVELVPSSREAFGRVTIEAMFAGMPVIASASGANLELIDEGKNGLFFMLGDSKMLAQRMLEFISDYSKVEKMGEYAFAGAISTYTSKKNADEIEKVYYQILM